MRKVAIVRRNGFGDLLLAMPAIFALKKTFPSCSITLFLGSRNAALIPYLPQIVDHYVTFPEKGNKYVHHLKIGFKHRKEKFDLALSAKVGPMKLMNLFLFALGAKRRIAYVDKGWTSFLVNKRVPFDQVQAYGLHQSLKTLKLLGHETMEETWYPKLSIPSHLIKKYFSPFHKELVILLSATTTNATSRISPFKYAQLINRLYHQSPFSVLLMGERKDEQRLASISYHLKMPHVCRIPENFDEFMVLQSYCDLYFVPDGGMAHIGAGLDKHQLILYGSTSPVMWAPLSKKAFCLHHGVHVDHIDDEEIFDALCRKFVEVERGRVHL